MDDHPRLATRFGKNYHRSYVRMKLERLRESGLGSMRSFEEWLIEVAKLRADKVTSQPSLANVPDEELIIGLLLLENLDRPGLLESAALILARLAVDQKELARLCEAGTSRFSASRAHGRGFRKIGHANCFPATALVRATSY
jgi:hypothetical protein